MKNNPKVFCETLPLCVKPSLWVLLSTTESCQSITSRGRTDASMTFFVFHNKLLHSVGSYFVQRWWAFLITAGLGWLVDLPAIPNIDKSILIHQEQ